MAHTADVGTAVGSRPHTAMAAGDATYQAYQLLHFVFIVAPIVAGADKYFHVLVNWDQYLAPQIARMFSMGVHRFMLLVGVIEVVAGVLVAFKPRIGAYIVALWLWGIIVNLLVMPGYFDIALRDFGLSLGALALARLSMLFDLPTIDN